MKPARDPVYPRRECWRWVISGPYRPLQRRKRIWKCLGSFASCTLRTFLNKNRKTLQTFFPFVGRDRAQQARGWGTGQGLQLEPNFFLCWFSLSSFPVFSQARHWPPAVLPPVSSVDPRALWLCSLHLGDILGGRGEGEIYPLVDLQFFFYSLFMSLQQSFFLTPQLSQMQDFGEKVLCSCWGGYSQLPWLGTTGRRGAVPCVPQSPARRWRSSLVQKVLCQLANVILKVILTSPSDNCSH